MAEQNSGGQLAADQAHNPTRADATPLFDNWGPDWIDGYWTLDDWLHWHQANVQAYGLAAANAKFSTAWKQQSYGAGPTNEIDYDFDARQYMAATGLLNLIPATLGGFLTDASGTTQQVMGDLPRTTKAVSWILPAAGIGLLILAVRSIGKDPGGQAKKVLSGVGSLY